MGRYKGAKLLYILDPDYKGLCPVHVHSKQTSEKCGCWQDGKMWVNDTCTGYRYLFYNTKTKATQLYWRIGRGFQLLETGPTCGDCPSNDEGNPLVISPTRRRLTAHPAFLRTCEDVVGAQ